MLLPKGTRVVGVDVGPVITSELTRPLSVVNADSRILAGSFRSTLQRVADKRAVETQRGVLSGRSILASVVDVDDAWRLAGLSGSESLLALLDIKAAFPSLSHGFLFRFLQDFGIPDLLITAISKFYQDCEHDISLAGDLFPKASG